MPEEFHAPTLKVPNGPKVRNPHLRIRVVKYFLLKYESSYELFAMAVLGMDKVKLIILLTRVPHVMYQG
jgi:hypothetical protein